VIPPEWEEHIGASEEVYKQVSAESYRALLELAESGDAVAMHNIGQYYQSGQHPVTCDSEKCLAWCERAFQAGNIFAANDLYSAYAEPGANHDPERAKYYLEILEEADMRFVTIWRNGKEYAE
jgi:TPR repeat protein